MKTYVSDALRADWSKHVLVPMSETREFCGFYLRDPKYARMQGCMILFTPEGIVICGDWCPNDNRGCVSVFNYDLSWFSRPLGEGYLCSKFLQQEYRPERARQYVEGRVEELAERDEDSEKDPLTLGILKRALDEDDGTQNDGLHFGTIAEFVALMEETDDYDAITDGVCEDYNPNSAAMLCVIQQRFVETYRERQNGKAKYHAQCVYPHSQGVCSGHAGDPCHRKLER